MSTATDAETKGREIVAQMTLFGLGARSGDSLPKSEIKACDRIQAEPKFSGTYVVTSVDDNIHGPVYICTSTVDGSDAIILHREVTVHFRHHSNVTAI